MGRADDGPDAGQPVLSDEVFAPLRHEPGDVLPEHPAVAEPDVLDAPAALVGGLDETEDPAAVAATSAEERFHRVAAEVWIDCHRVRNRGIALEVGGRVGPGSRADVAAL